MEERCEEVDVCSDVKCKMGSKKSVNIRILYINVIDICQKLSPAPV